GVGLVGKPDNADRLAADIAAARLHYAIDYGVLALIVVIDGGCDDRHLRFISFRRLEQRQRVLGEARTAIARAGIQEFVADALVHADAFGNVLHVAAD